MILRSVAPRDLFDLYGVFLRLYTAAEEVAAAEEEEEEREEGGWGAFEEHFEPDWSASR